jgi:hypothetical protein
MIAERFGGLDEGLVSRGRRTIREKIEPEIRKWFQDLISLSGLLVQLVNMSLFPIRFRQACPVKA